MSVIISTFIVMSRNINSETISITVLRTTYTCICPPSWSKIILTFISSPSRELYAINTYVICCCTWNSIAWRSDIFNFYVRNNWLCSISIIDRVIIAGTFKIGNVSFIIIFFKLVFIILLFLQYRPQLFVNYLLSQPQIVLMRDLKALH